MILSLALPFNKNPIDLWYNLGYTLIMKTAISIPDPLFRSAEKLSHQLGLSRSQLYVTAIKEFLQARKQHCVMEKLNEIYGGMESGLDPSLQSLQARSVPKDIW